MENDHIARWETLFGRLFGWVKSGTPYLDGHRWIRGEWTAEQIEFSPAGPFNLLRGRGWSIHLRPAAARGIGTFQRIDIRGGNPLLLADFQRIVEEVTAPPVVDPVADLLERLEDPKLLFKDEEVVLVPLCREAATMIRHLRRRLAAAGPVVTT